MIEMANATSNRDLLPMAVSVLHPKNESMLKQESPPSRCGLCLKIMRGRPMYRIYVADIATEPYGRNIQTVTFPIAWRFDDDEQYDESCWYYIDAACAQSVPEGYLDTLLRAVKVGQKVKIKDSLAVKDQYRAERGVVAEVRGKESSPSRPIAVEHRIGALGLYHRTQQVIYGLDVLESEGGK